MITAFVCLFGFGSSLFSHTEDRSAHFTVDLISNDDPTDLPKDSCAPLASTAKSSLDWEPIPVLNFSDEAWISIGTTDRSQSPTSGLSGPVYAIAVLGGKVYAGGDTGVAVWDGSNWSALGHRALGRVRALAVSDGNLYAGGDFGNHVARWDGTEWSPLGLGVGGPSGPNAVDGGPVVTAMVASEGNLYVGGSFRTAGGKEANHIAMWDGSNWSALGSGLDSSRSREPVASMVVLDGDLYVAGDITTAGGKEANYIAKWDGSEWSAVGSDFKRPIRALAVSGSDLYAGGDIDGIARWNGREWSRLSLGILSTSALTVSGGNLYAAGRPVISDGGVSYRIVRWNREDWSALGTDFNAPISALTVHNGDLYAGGTFRTIGEEDSAYISMARDVNASFERAAGEVGYAPSREEESPTLAKLMKIRIPSLEFSGTPLSRVVSTLHAISQEYDTTGISPPGVPLVLIDRVRRNPEVTISIKDMPLGQILDAIVESVGFSFNIQRNIAVVSFGRQCQRSVKTSH